MGWEFDGSAVNVRRRRKKRVKRKNITHERKKLAILCYI